MMYAETKKRRPPFKRPRDKAEATILCLKLMAEHGVTAEDLGVVDPLWERYSKLTDELMGTSVRLPPFEDWKKRVK